MLLPYIKLALRNLFNQRLSVVINLFGLTVGLTSAFFVMLFILNEFSYDRHHANADRIYRVTEYNHVHQWMMSTTSFPLADAIQEESPAVELAVRVFTAGPDLVT